MRIRVLLLVPALVLAPAVFANEVRINDVRVECAASCTFSVTLEHADEGWNHYADQWDVVTLDGKLLKSRVLHHPHENEQPFTRSLGGIIIPDGITTVTVQAHDSVHGYGGKIITIQLPR